MIKAKYFRGCFSIFMMAFLLCASSPWAMGEAPKGEPLSVIDGVTSHNPSAGASSAIAYGNQKSIECGQEKINIPEFYPSSTENLFLQFEGQCSGDAVDIFIGIGEGCNGAHACRQYSFSKRKLNAGHVHSALDSIFEQTLDKVKLGKNVTGYFIPVQVFAYSTPSRIIWMDRHYIYVIAAKGGEEDDLIKSANSFINVSQ